MSLGAFSGLSGVQDVGPLALAHNAIGPNTRVGKVVSRDLERAARSDSDGANLS